MRTQPQPTRGDDDVTIPATIIGIASGAGLLHWLAANLAALLGRGRPLDANPIDAVVALVGLPDHASDPRLAWEEPARSNLPGPVVYWFAVAAVVLAAIVVAGVVARWLGERRHEPPDKRRRLGTETQARLAATGDLRPLLTRRPVPGRFVLARWGRRCLSTEGGNNRHRRAVQGAVAVFGPSQSGKTTGLIGGVAAWAGPAIVSSVKSDLVRATVDIRSGRGDVKVFDPLGVTGRTSATWSPLRGAADLPHALAAAQMLARAGGDEGSNDRFWRGQAEQLIAAMLWTAANTEGHTMRHVVRWVLELDRPQDGGGGTLAPLVRLLTDHPEPSTAFAARQVQGWLHGQWSTDPRTTSSVYATARNAVWPWADPKIAATADSCDITLDWLLGGANTLYLSAPLGDESRIGIVFAVLLHDLISQAFNRYNHSGDPLDPRLLVLLDEAANTPLPKLPQWASTVTGAGIQLVTVWQSKAQLDQIYGRDAETVLTNHRSKLIYPSSLSDLSTVQYISDLIGDEHVRSDLDDRSGWTVNPERPSGRSPGTAVPFLPASTLRRAQVGDALLIHGSLPPAWIPAKGRATGRG